MIHPIEELSKELDRQPSDKQHIMLCSHIQLEIKVKEGSNEVQVATLPIQNLPPAPPPPKRPPPDEPYERLLCEEEPPDEDLLPPPPP